MSKKSNVVATIEPIETDALAELDGVHGQVRRMMTADHLSYVLVTCKKSSRKGEMEVQMTYEGDPVLASYLVKGAQDQFEQDFLEQEVDE